MEVSVATGVANCSHPAPAGLGSGLKCACDFARQLQRDQPDSHRNVIMTIAEQTAIPQKTRQVSLSSHAESNCTNSLKPYRLLHLQRIAEKTLQALSECAAQYRVSENDLLSLLIDDLQNALNGRSASNPSTSACSFAPQASRPYLRLVLQHTCRWVLLKSYVVAVVDTDLHAVLVQEPISLPRTL